MDYSSLAAAEAAGRDPNSFENKQFKGYMPNAAKPQQTTKAPDMSAYKQTSFTPPQGARANDLSGQVPANQMWAQAYNQASNQYGGNTQAQSWTMPGFYSSQGYNPTTGQYGQPTGGQSWDGNMAYQPIDSRPGPITATATGINGQTMPWQDTLTQREAFTGNLSQRLGQYSGGQLSGPPTFDARQLLSQANDQLSTGSFYNPFSQSQPVQRAMGNATPYMQGQWQNPFGNSPQANNPQPSWDQQNYDPQARTRGLTYDGAGTDFYDDSGFRPQPQHAAAQFAPIVNVPARPDYNAPAPSGPIQLAPIVNVPSRRTSPSVAQSTPPPSQGTPYDPQAQVQGLPDVPETAPARVQYGYRAQANPVARTTQTPQPDATQAQLAKIDKEINQWKRATYGTRQGGGPPAEWYSHIQALQRLRTKAAAGDPAALAWNPKMKAPAANVTPTVPLNRRGSSARFGSMRQNGDNRR